MRNEICEKVAKTENKYCEKVKSSLLKEGEFTQGEAI